MAGAPGVEDRGGGGSWRTSRWIGGPRVHEPTEVERRGQDDQPAQAALLRQGSASTPPSERPSAYTLVSLGERVVRRHDGVDPARPRQPLQLGVDRPVAGQERALAVEASLGQRLGRRPHLVRSAGQAVHAKDRGREPAARVAEPEGRRVDAHASSSSARRCAARVTAAIDTRWRRAARAHDSYSGFTRRLPSAARASFTEIGP